MVIIEADGGEKDPRVEFLADFTLKSLRLKSDKWARLLISDEQRTYLSRFIDHTVPQVYVTERLLKNSILAINTSDIHNYLYIS